MQAREGRFPTELSGGQQQRVGIARSLTTNPDFWFLDEPFSALDALIRADLQAEVLRLQELHNRTVIFVTHDLDEAIRLADRIALMEGGRIVQIGTPEELVTRPATDYVRRFVAKVSPARVIRVSSLMTPVDGGTAISRIRADATISEVAPELVAATGTLPVLDGGRQVGSLDRMRALATLAEGVRPRDGLRQPGRRPSTSECSPQPWKGGSGRPLCPLRTAKRPPGFCWWRKCSAGRRRTAVVT
jgi:glycine betaine/proline transport system ATP-binding protein